MDFKNLAENNDKLISYLRDNHYCADYISWFECEINWILQESALNEYATYEDIYRDRISRRSYSKSTQDMKKTIIGAIKQFDLYGKYPDSRSGHSMLRAAPNRKLSSEFQKITDCYYEKAKKSGKQPGTIRAQISITTSFFLSMQQNGENTISEITEASVLNFFHSRRNEKTNGYYCRSQISNVLKAYMSLNPDECKRVLNYLPELRAVRKTVQYLTDDEAAQIRCVLSNMENSLLLRDRAIGMLLLYTGIRTCDIAGLRLEEIEWEKDQICFQQQKTNVPLQLPLFPVVGNAIYDYLVQERPDSQDPHVFLTQTRPFNPLTCSSIANIVNVILRAANVRQLPEDRRGAHIFRHHAATVLLQNGTPRTVISRALGHTSPDALNTYLHANFKALKGCSLDVSCFPVAKEVLGDA